MAQLLREREPPETDFEEDPSYEVCRRDLFVTFAFWGAQYTIERELARA